MCWNTPERNCDECQKIFDNCKCTTTFKNEDDIRECVFCSKLFIQDNCSVGCNGNGECTCKC